MTTATVINPFIIDRYTRAEALADGVLFDVSTLAKEAGIKFPVAITAGVHSLCTPPQKSYQSFEGRLWDVVHMFKYGIKTSGGSRFTFSVILGKKRWVLLAVCGPGDNYEPVITIMLPNEE